MIIAYLVVKKYMKTLFIDLSWTIEYYRCSQRACAVSRDLRVGSQKQPHIWNPRPQFVFSLYNFYGSTMTIKGTLLTECPL